MRIHARKRKEGRFSSSGSLQQHRAKDVEGGTVRLTTNIRNDKTDACEAGHQDRMEFVRIACWMFEFWYRRCAVRLLPEKPLLVLRRGGAM